MVKIEQCLDQLDNKVKQKIIAKQNEIMGEEQEDDLQKRLLNNEFRKRLLTSLTELEQKHFKMILNKFSLYSNDNCQEEQTTSIEEKLALLLLRQRGIVFKLQEKMHKQNFIVPLEFVESYFELTFETQRNQGFHKDVSIKKYLSYLFKLLFFVEEKSSSFHLNALKDVHPDYVNWDLLFQFLLHEQLVIYVEENKLVVVAKNCDLFFQSANIELKQRLAAFIFRNLTRQQVSFHLLFWAIAKGKGVHINELMKYLSKYPNFSEQSFSDALGQLVSLEIVSISNDFIVFETNDETDSLEMLRGMEAGWLEFLVPVSLENDTLWTFSCWSKVLQWEPMIHFVITFDTVKNALKAQRNIYVLFELLKKNLPKNIISQWEPTLEQWVTQNNQITKKENLVLYTITEKLHLKFIEEHWPNWHEKITKGILIEQCYAETFEKLLSKLSLTISTQKGDHDENGQKFQLPIVNEYPLMESVIPEIAKLPKQWFILTAYEERMMQRIVKQVIVLQLSLQIESTDRRIIKFNPVKLLNNNGCYEILAQDNRKYQFADILKLAIIDPLKK